jgi:hypothetical protein
MEKIDSNIVKDQYNNYYSRIEGLLNPRYHNNCYRCVFWPTSKECIDIALSLGSCEVTQYIQQTHMIDKDVIQEVQII